MYTLAASLSDNSTSGLSILCTILLFAVIVSFILGLVQVLGLDGGRLGARVGGRYGTLVVFFVLLVAYILFC